MFRVTYRSQQNQSNAKSDVVHLPSVNTTTTGSTMTTTKTSSTAPSYVPKKSPTAKKSRGLPQLPKVAGWRGRTNAAPQQSETAEVIDMQSQRKLPAPGKQKFAHFTQVQPTAPQTPRHQPALASPTSGGLRHQPPIAHRQTNTGALRHDSGTLRHNQRQLARLDRQGSNYSLGDDGNEDRYAIIAGDSDELADRLDEAMDDDELEFFDCRATRKWRAMDSERRAKNVDDQNPTVSSTKSRASVASISSDLPGYVGALARRSRLSTHEAYHDTASTDAKTIIDHTATNINRINKVMDMMMKEEAKEAGCEIVETYAQSIPHAPDEKKPRLTWTLGKMKNNIQKVFEQLEDQ